MYFYGLYLVLRSGSFMYFSTANPCMKYSGVIGDSKFSLLSSIPAQYIPKTVLVPISTSYSRIKRIIEDEGFEYPFILKPDVGERGKDVELIANEKELRAYLIGKSVDLTIQEYIEDELEFGIMYYRLPDDDKGQITSIVQKGFLSVTGDGKQTIRELLSSEIRAKSRLKYFHDKFEIELQHILPNGEKKDLEPIGNHCRGTTFYNANHLINEKLNMVFNKIALQIDGYYYGRFDIKVSSQDDLYAGKNIKILELNGVSSEVAHVYDPNYKLIQAYKDIGKHMHYIYQIAKQNHAKGYTYDPLWKFLRELRNHLKS